jgi:hypothetical protein
VARNTRRIEFRGFDDMARHLNAWAATSLIAPDQWSDALLAAQHWLDYSGRNQVLLASYGVDGPVAGQETWRLVPSTTPDRPCAVRAGEHGWPVRVPITTGGSEPDPYLGGARPSRSRTDRFEWRPVFGVDQLARRPDPGALTPVEIPDRLTGPRAPDAYLDVVRQVAKTTVRGRLRGPDDPHQLLTGAAVRLSHGAKGPPLEPVLGEQVAWLVAERVGFTPGPLPAFDPEPLEPRDRWQRLQAVLDPARRLTAALGHVTGVDLTASPLPKMEIVDDRAIPAGRRRRLPAASFERLPVGTWVEVGPYTGDEWAARGENADGRGAYLRLNRSAYVVTFEIGTEAVWRLEDVAERTGHGLLANGEAPGLAAAQADAIAALAGRYPALETARPVVVTVEPQRAGGLPPPEKPWEPTPGRGTSAATQRQLDERITLYAFPGPGGRWLPAVHDGFRLTPLPYARNIDDAQSAAEFAGRRAQRRAVATSPAGRDAAVAALTASDDYTRAELVDLVGDVLLDETRDQLAAPETTPDTIVDALRVAGCTPATAVAVLHAEGIDADVVAPLLPTIGVPMDQAIRVLHERWDVSRVQAAESLGATAVEMRAAGCTAVEVMAARPRDILRSLPTSADVWATAALTMIEGGHSTAKTISHLVAHAPTAAAFGLSVSAVADDAAAGLTIAVRYGAQSDQLAAAAEAYDLRPKEAATVLADAGATRQVTVEAIHELCDHDVSLTAEAVRLEPQIVDSLLTSADTEGVTPLVPDSPDPMDTRSLLAHLPDPEPSTDLTAEGLLAMLPDPDTPELPTPEATP